MVKYRYLFAPSSTVPSQFTAQRTMPQSDLLHTFRVTESGVNFSEVCPHALLVVCFACACVQVSQPGGAELAGIFILWFPRDRTERFITQRQS